MMDSPLKQENTPRVSRIWLDLFRLIDERFFFPTKRAYLADLFAPHIGSDDTLLDVGCSSGHLAGYLMEKIGCTFKGVDVYIQPDTVIPVQHYDGLHIPFDNHSFDAAMMVDMLHHTAHPEQVMREALRVSRRYLIVKDHYWESNLDWKVLEVADYVGNAPYGIESPNHYLRLEEWHRMFETLNLKVTHMIKFKHLSIDPCKNFMVKLEKK